MNADHLHQALAGAGLVALAALAVAMSRHRRRRTEAKAYLKGVRSMLSGDPDGAIEALSGAARLGTPQARETYLALGALFRRSGDLSRAIRLHRNMLAAGALQPAERLEVERELAEDYRRSGMLAEAAALLEPRAAADLVSATALVRVWADQGAWREAAALQARLAGEPGGPDRLRAHLLAAAARAELSAAVAGREPPDVAARALQAAHQAVAADPTCGAALLALAEAEGAAGQGQAGLATLARALDTAPGAAVLAWGPVVRQPDRDGALRLLAERAASAPADAALRMLSGRLLHRLDRRTEALATLRSALELDESGEVTLALRDLLRETGSSSAAEEGDDLRARHELAVMALRRRAQAVRCTRCGAEAACRAWRCRGCGAFDTLAATPGGPPAA